MRSKWTGILMIVGCISAFPRLAPAAESIVRTYIVLDHVTGCTGEPVLVEGVLLLHGRAGADGSGGEHLMNFTSFHGTGYTADGTRYTLVTVGRGVNNSNGAGPEEEGGTQPEGAAAWTGTHVQPIVGIRQGEAVLADDLHFLAVFHYTFAPDGRLTAFLETFESTCR